MFAWWRRFFLGLLHRDKSSHMHDSADVYQGLREQALHLQRTEVGIPAPPETAPVWGVLMEFHASKATVTLFTLVDGTASLYFSNGGGVIGGHAHEAVRRAVGRFIGVANQLHVHLVPSRSLPLPEPGEVVFYLLTDGGKLTATVPESDLGQKSHLLSLLFYAGHGVITELRVVSENNDPTQ